MPRPNILLIVLDSVRRDHLPVYGYEKGKTPTLDEFTNTATRYDQAIAAAPWTPLSHASMFSGLYPSHHGVFGRQPQYDNTQPHVAQELAEAGYSTLGFSNSYHTSKNRGFDRGFDFYHDIRDLPHLKGNWFEPSIPFIKFVVNHLLNQHDTASFQLDKFERFLPSITEPFFGFINLNSAHSPYNPPNKFKKYFESRFDAYDSVDKEAARAVGNREGYKYMMGDIDMGITEWNLIKCWYDGEIAYMDQLLGEFFDALQERNLFEDTMIVITSDHGEHFGENGLAYHQFSLSEELINVPLLIKWPRQKNAEVSDELVSLVDLRPTFLDIGDVSSSMDEIDGRSLISCSEPDNVFAEFGRPYEGTLGNLIDSMFENINLEAESISERLEDYQERVDRYDRGLQAIRTKSHKLVKPTRGEMELYQLKNGKEKLVDNAELERELADKLSSKLGELPTGSYSEELPEHIEEHLIKMGYL